MINERTANGPDKLIHYLKQRSLTAEIARLPP
jgi:hypothetical protein